MHAVLVRVQDRLRPVCCLRQRFVLAFAWQLGHHMHCLQRQLCDVFDRLRLHGVRVWILSHCSEHVHAVFDDWRAVHDVRHVEPLHGMQCRVRCKQQQQLLHLQLIVYECECERRPAQLLQRFALSDVQQRRQQRMRELCERVLP
jgi:hypothetical protein